MKKKIKKLNKLYEIYFSKNPNEQDAKIILRKIVKLEKSLEKWQDLEGAQRVKVEEEEE